MCAKKCSFTDCKSFATELHPLGKRFNRHPPTEQIPEKVYRVRCLMRYAFD